jgi:3-carboxy-cis,cis-muconate cycloisomerase
MPAHKILEKASKRSAENSQPLQSVLMEDSEVRQHLSTDDIKRLLEPKNYTGSAEIMVNKVLADRKQKSG